MIARHLSLLFLMFVLGLIFASCTPAEEYLYCETAFDCPEGWECGPEFVCVEIGETADTSGGSDQSLPEQESMLLDEGVAPVDEEDGVATDDASIMDEDTAIADDATAVDEDEDTFETDDSLMLDEDNVIVDDQPVVDEDTAVADDVSVLDEDTLVIDDDIPVVDQDITEKTKVIGTDTSQTNTMPWSPSASYRYSATIYTKAQLSTSAITITRLAWQSSTSGTSPGSANIKILLKETTATAIASSTPYTVIKSDATEVFSGTLTGTQGWNEKVLDTPFAYSGTKNLMVLTEFTCTPAITRYWYFSGSGSTISHGWYGNTDPAGENGINLEGYPNLKVTYY